MRDKKARGPKYERIGRIREERAIRSLIAEIEGPASPPPVETFTLDPFEPLDDADRALTALTDQECAAGSRRLFEAIRADLHREARQKRFMRAGCLLGFVTLVSAAYLVGPYSAPAHRLSRRTDRSYE